MKFDYLFEQYSLWYTLSLLEEAIYCYTSSKVAQKERLWRHRPTVNAHSDVLGLPYCTFRLSGLTLQGHLAMGSKEPEKGAADGTLYILCVRTIGFRQLIENWGSEVKVSHTPG